MQCDCELREIPGKLIHTPDIPSIVAEDTNLIMIPQQKWVSLSLSNIFQFYAQNHRKFPYASISHHFQMLLRNTWDKNMQFIRWHTVEDGEENTHPKWIFNGIYSNRITPPLSYFPATTSISKYCVYLWFLRVLEVGLEAFIDEKT